MPLTNDDRTLSGDPRSGTVYRGNPVARPPSRGLWLVAVSLVLTAVNLRPAVSGLGPLLEEIRRDLEMSGTVAGLLTSVPALCFAVFGGTAPRLARRHGPVAVVLAGLVAITAGTVLRSLAGGTTVFLATSALALAGVAVSNVLMPVIGKRYFPDRIGTVTGLYSMALAFGTAAAAAFTVPLARALGGGWRTGLGSWAVLGTLAVLCWLLVVLLRGRDRGRAPTGDVAKGPEPGAARLTRSTTAWALAVLFGLQATAAYVTMGWMPQIFRDAGVSAATAGLLLAVIMGMGVPLAFVLPRVAARMRHQGPLVALLGVAGLSGYAGLWLAPAAGAWLWAVLLGVSNCAFPVVLTMRGLRSRTSAGVARLSGFVQSTGYLISVPGPLVVGVLHDHSGDWRLPLLLLAVLMFAQITFGVLAGRDRCVEDGG
jgi:MFS transporter, CP family, cyanate transporter